MKELEQTQSQKLQTQFVKPNELLGNCEEKLILDGKYIINRNGFLKSIKKQNYILKGSKDKEGWYINYMLLGKKTYLHRILAENFIPNPLNKKYVNHINGIKSDNRIENLEWCTCSENAIHAHKNGLNYRPCNSGKKKKPVIQMTTNGEFVKKWDSISEAARNMNVDKMNIIMVAKNKKKTSAGFKWKYE